MRRFARRAVTTPVAPVLASCGRRCDASASSQPARDVTAIVAALEKDRDTLNAVVQKMNPESRRRLVIAGGTIEWFGTEKIEEEVAAADTDQDKFISPKDFDNWFASAMKRCPRDETGAPSGAPSARVPLAALALIAFEAGLPFVGFGFLDNAVMILAGDAIDQSLGWYLHCSVLASAAMGNVVSGMLGMQVHGIIDKLVQRLNLPTPVLTDSQRRGQRVFMAGHLGGTLGIAIGLSMGMLPLLLIRGEEESLEDAAFSNLDVDENGNVTVAELRRGLAKVGITPNEGELKALVARYSGGGTALNEEQFHDLCSSLRGGDAKCTS